MNEQVRQFAEACAAQGAALAMEQMGVTSGLISESRARKVYGKWLIEHLKRGDLAPAYCGDRKKYFRVADILALRTADLAPMNIILK